MKKQGTWKTVAALFAFAAFAPAGAAAETYAKPVLDDGTGGYVLKDGYVLKFFTNAECTEENTAQTAIDGETTVFFASDAEFQALVARKDEIDDAGAKVVLQNDVKLTENVDWRAFDFNINGWTITLAGYKLSAGRIAGEGTITAGELVVNGGFQSSAANQWNQISAAKDGWSRDGDCNIGIFKSGVQLYKADGSNWAVLYTTNKSHSVVAAIKQSVTLPKDGMYYLSFRYQTAGYTEGSKTKYYCDLNVGDGSKLSVTAGSITKDTYSPEKSIKTGCIELAGKSAGEILQLIFASNSKAHGLCIDDVSLTPLSILELEVPEGAEYDAGGLTLKGTGLQVIKSGAGRIVFSKSNASWRYNGYVSLTVSEGYAKQTEKNACGAQYSKIEVCDGAQFDFNGMAYWDYNYQISGSGPAGDGALTSSAVVSAADARKKVGYGFLKDVTLGADATIRAAEGANFGMWLYWAEGENTYRTSTMTMNGYTVTYDCQTRDGATIYLGGMSYSGEGKIVVAANATVQPHNMSPEAKGCDVEVYGLWKQNNYVLSPVKSLVFREGSRFGEWAQSPSKKTLIYERYAPNQGVESDDQPVKHPIVQLGDKDHQSPTLDLSYHPGAFYDNGETPTLRYYDTEDPEHPMNVKVDVSERNCARGRAIYIYGTNTPANVRFVAGEKMVAAKISLRVRDHGDEYDGLYTLPGTTIVIR